MTAHGFARRHSVLVFYLAAFVLSWGGMPAVIVAHGGVPATWAELDAQLPLVLRDQGTLTRSDVAKGALYAVAFAAIGVAGPNLVGRDKDNPHVFTEARMGPHGATDGA